MDEIEKIKSDLLLKRLNSAEELQDWIYTYLDIKFPMGVIYPTSTHGPVEAMWRIYELILTGDSKSVPQATMLSSRDSYKCQVKGTLLLKQSGFSKIENIKVGDTVWSGFAWRKVTDWIDDGVKKSINFKLRNGLELSGSPIHRYWCLRDGIEQWVESKDINKTDLFCVNTNTGMSKKNLTTNQDEYDTGYFLGLLAGDGSVSTIDSPTHCHFALTNIDQKITDWYYNYIVNVLESRVAPSKGDLISHATWDKEAVEKIKNLGVKPHISWEKEIPSYCYKSHSAMIGFINGLFDTDGSFSSKNQTIIPITAGKLVYELQKVLIGYGIDARIISNKKLYKQKGGVNQNHLIHQLYINSNEFERLTNIGFKCTADKASFVSKPKIYDAHDVLPIPHIQFFLDFCKNNVPQIRGRKHIKPKISVKRNSDGKDYKGITYGKLRELLNWLEENIEKGKAGGGAEDVAQRMNSLLSNKWFEYVVKKESESHFFDLTVEVDHSYWSNGVISHNTLAASALIVLLMAHFRLQLATAGAIKAQSDKMIQYIGQHFRKIDKYLVGNGWQKMGESKARTDWLDENGGLCFARVVVATIAGMNCVKGNTSIITDSGLIDASGIFKKMNNGETFKFLSFNHDTNETEYKDVVATQKVSHKKLLKIKTKKGTIECSPGHKFYIKGRGYVEAKDLVVGDVTLARKHVTFKSYEEVKKVIEDAGVELLTPKEDYVNESVEMEVRCKNGHVKKTSYQNFTRKNRQKCSVCKSVTFEMVKNKIESEGYLLNTKKPDYSGTKCFLNTTCPNGHNYNTTYNNFSTKNNRCVLGECHKKRLKLEFVREQFEKEGYTPIVDHYENQRQKIPVICPKGHTTEIGFSNFYNHGRRCRYCHKPLSKAHQEIHDYVESIYSGEVTSNDKTIIHPLEIDTYVPELKFGIEFDGLYWHSDKQKKDAKKYNIRKAKSLKEKGISILMVFEDEWTNPVKQELIKGMIRHRLGIHEEKLRASKLEIRKMIKNKEYKDFFDRNHLDGHTNASFAYGLFLGDKMVSCMSFRKSFSDKAWEIARFASDFDYKIHGNAGKMIKRFREEYGERLVTFSNNRLSLGKTYQTLGFKEITKTTDPSYYYTDFKIRLWRFKCRRINTPEIIDEYPTEKAQALGGVFSRKYLGHSRALYKIYDYGHRKWELE